MSKLGLVMYRIIGYGIFISLLLTACKKKNSTSTASSPRPAEVVKIEALESMNRQYSGTVKAVEFGKLAFKLSGTLQEMNVQTGQHIKKGQVIARIQPQDYQLQYETAQSNYQTAKSIYERNKHLLADNAIAAQEFEIAEADYIQAASALNIAQNTLEYTTLKAPFDGFIEKKYVDNFEEIQAGQAIVQLVNPEKIEIHFILPETQISALRIPKKIYVEFNTPKGKRFHADVKEYVYASQGSGIPVVLDITDKEFETYRKNIFPGFSCRIIWAADNMIADKFIIPASALQTIDNKEYVWLVNPSAFTVHQQEIQTRHMHGHIFVESGLNNNDRIVIAGISALREGQAITIKEK